MIAISESAQIELSSEISPESFVAFVSEHSANRASWIGRSNIVSVELLYLCKASNCELGKILVFTEIKPVFGFFLIPNSAKYNSYSLDLQSETYSARTWQWNRPANTSELCFQQDTLDNQAENLVDDVIARTNFELSVNSTDDYVVVMIWDGYFKNDNCYWTVGTGNNLRDYVVPFNQLDI